MRKCKRCEARYGDLAQVISSLNPNHAEAVKLLAEILLIKEEEESKEKVKKLFHMLTYDEQLHFVNELEKSIKVVKK